MYFIRTIADGRRVDEAETREHEDIAFVARTLIADAAENGVTITDVEVETVDEDLGFRATVTHDPVNL